MTSPSRELTRRNLLARSAAWALAPGLFAGTATAGNQKRPRVAAIFTEFRFRSHAYNILENPVHVNDLNATILHTLGIDHERFTYRYLGLDQRLTGVEGSKVVKDLLA